MTQPTKQDWRLLRIELSRTEPGSAQERAVYSKLMQLEDKVHPKVLDDWLLNG